MFGSLNRRFRRPGLRARSTLALGISALALSAALAFLTYELTRSRLMADRREVATTQAFSNARLALTGLRGDDPDIGQLLGSIQRRSSSVVVLRFGGSWFVSAVGFDDSVLPGSLRGIVFEDQAAGHQRVRVGDVPYLAVGVPLVGVDAQYFELVPFDQLENTLAEMARVLVLGAGIITGVGAVLGLWLSGRVLRPLRRVAAAAGEITEGAIGMRLEADGDADLRPLVESFNDMVDALEERIAQEGQFASEVSHELREPIAAMTSAIAVARRHADDPERTAEALAALDRQVREFHGFVEDLLEMTRLESGTAVIERIPRETGHLVRASIEERGYDVPVHVDPDIPRLVDTDPRRVGQVIANLLDNARRYAGGATAVRVSSPESGWVRIVVEDRGPGIPPEERARIFRRFERGSVGRDAGSGTGLGLALVAEHTRLLGGRVWVDDHPEGGSRFVVDLPQEAP